ncbi:hypothetical protein [Halomonas sp. CSM-2]|uniref:hypothetical protein n=1 Tax=Halomonas sp. CSM-2 TaxID=1975722 RepID=UPI0020CB12B0|nr:hypothetical protein [Halomonas sp. CSM-2]
MDPNPTARSPLRNAEKTVLADSANLHMATTDNTHRTYRATIRSFERWGGRLPTQPATLAAYLSDQATGLNPRTLDVYLTALGRWHQTQGLRDPARDPGVRKTLEGIRAPMAGRNGKPGRCASNTLRPSCKRSSSSLTRSRSIATGPCCRSVFFGAFRRSELVTIEVMHLSWEPE